MAEPQAAPAEIRGKRPRRWRRRLIILIGVFAAAYAALWIVRLARDMGPVQSRRFLDGAPLVIAHRGASAVAAEHTITAYRRAL